MATDIEKAPDALQQLVADTDTGGNVKDIRLNPKKDTDMEKRLADLKKVLANDDAAPAAQISAAAEALRLSEQQEISAKLVGLYGEQALRNAKMHDEACKLRALALEAMPLLHQKVAELARRNSEGG